MKTESRQGTVLVNTRAELHGSILHRDIVSDLPYNWDSIGVSHDLIRRPTAAAFAELGNHNFPF